MPRIKPNWEREFINLREGISAESWSAFLKKFATHVDATNSKYDESCRLLFVTLSLCKQGRKKGPSSKETEAAAIALNKAAKNLSVMLSAGCGGLLVPLLGAGVKPYELAKDLKTVAEVCRKFNSNNLENPYEDAKSHITIARFVRFVLEEKLGYSAKIYISEDHGGESLYAKILKDCFISAFGYVPRSIKQHLCDANKNRLPPHQSDYWVDLSEEEFNEVLSASLEGFWGHSVLM